MSAMSMSALFTISCNRSLTFKRVSSYKRANDVWNKDTKGTLVAHFNNDYSTYLFCVAGKTPHQLREKGRLQMNQKKNTY